MEEHEDGVAEVVVDVGDDVEDDQEGPDQVVLDVVLGPDQLDLVHLGDGHPDHSLS